MERFTLQDAVRRNGQGSTWHQVDTIGSEPVELQAVATRPADEERELLDIEDLDDVELVDEDDYDFDLTELDAERLFWHQIGWFAFVVGSVFAFGVCIGILLIANGPTTFAALQEAVYTIFDAGLMVIDAQLAILQFVYDAIAPIFDLEQ
jgi:hypothetical protein